MNNIRKNIKNIAVATLVGASFAGCSLDLLPLNEVVLENFWTDKNDVASVVASCYEGMASSGYVTDLIVWGENRSDNIVAGPQADGALNNLLKGSLKTTNTYCDWSAIYSVINRCNTVLYYAPQVAEKDPNYTASDLRVNIAEVKAIRAYSYLTLIKTFKDVPFTLAPSIDDEADYRLGQTKFETILDSLILDIEGCKNDAPRRYTDETFNTGKFTRVAMYALLAELYLWRASDANIPTTEQSEYYRKCVEACDWVLNFKIEQYVNNDIRGTDLRKLVDPEVWAKYGYPLLAEALNQNSNADASNMIFGKGNSYESIFELTYRYGSTVNKNEALGFMYGGYADKAQNPTQKVVANDDMMPDYPKSTTYSDGSLFPVTTDYRSIASFRYTENGSFDILKYSCSAVNVDYTGAGQITYTNLPQQDFRSWEMLYPNWILYRMTDVMLMRAEAQIELAGIITANAATEEGEGEGDETVEGDETTEGGEESAEAHTRALSIAKNGASLFTAEELYDDAFNLILAVYTRSNPASKNTTSVLPARGDYKELADFRVLLMNERRRELMFEGKRYFDLVRQARREGNTDKFVQALHSKFGEGGAAVAIKMKHMDFMYMPILKRQIQVNPNLVQNSQYLDEEQIENN